MLYPEIIRFSFLRFLNYPYEIIAAVLRVIIEITFLIYFWTLYSTHASHSLGVTGYASYFLIAVGINDLVMAQFGKFAGILGDEIKTGKISNWIIKPVAILPTYYMLALGKTGMNKIISVCCIGLGLIIQPPGNVLSLVLFLFFLIQAVIISYAYNIVVATVFFHTGDAKGIRNAINQMVGIFSGLLIPISLFPNPLQQIVKYSPFPWMVFGPINGLRTTSLQSGILHDIVIVCFWSVMLNVLAYTVWSWSIKKYEAIGI